MKPVLKSPGSMLLKLIYDEPLSTSPFNFNLRRYTTVTIADFNITLKTLLGRTWQILLATSSTRIGRFRYVASRAER